MKSVEDPSNSTCSPSPPISHTDCIIEVVIFTSMSIFILLGNGLVVWIVLTTKRMRTVTNYFLVNLALGDMLSVFQIIPNIYVHIANDWPFGLAYCRFSQFFTAFSIALSVLTFIGLTADRYIAIKYPLRPRSRPSTILCIIGCIWVVAFLIGLPALIASHIEQHAPCFTNESPTTIPNTHTNITEEQIVQLSCILSWTEESGLAYDIVLFILMYILPMMILVATYVPIIVKLWSDRGLGEITRAQIDSIQSKRRVVKMLIAVMVIFAICWLPYQLFFLSLRAITDSNNPILPIIFICCYGLAMSNGMYNPIVYCIMNRRFRDGFLKAIGCCPFVKRHRRKCQRTRFHRNFQTMLVASEVGDLNPTDTQLSQRFHDNEKSTVKQQSFEVEIA